MEKFNVIHYNINAKKFEPYDVILYLVRCYEERVKRHNKILASAKFDLDHYKEIVDSSNDRYNKVPVTFDEFKQFVKDESMYQFWSRCEYEIILSDWPPSNPPIEEKWDVYDQIMMNLDIVTTLLMENIKENQST